MTQGQKAKIQAETGTGGVLIVSPAAMPGAPIPDNSTRNIMVGLILGLGLGLGLAFAMDYFDKSVRTIEDIERYTGKSVLGTIPDINRVRVKRSGSSKPSVPKNGHNGTTEHAYQLLPAIGSRNPLVEAYRSLRTDLQFVNVDEPLKSVMITSSVPGEGKTLTTANLAISYAELGKKVLIVDADMRKSMQHRIFSIEKSPGLSDWLARDDLAIDDVIQNSGISNLSIITAGTTPPNPAEMLDSQKMRQLVDELETKFELVLFDSPPLTVVSDPRIMSTRIKNVLLVVRADYTKYPAVQTAVNLVTNLDAKILGAILNGVGRSKGYGYYNYRYSYYNYSYYYSHDGGKKKNKSNRTKALKDKVTKSKV
ncbi:MAG: polysaccharide biosynthesis tyrosine autokinase [candidate division KSB1 bacterium]|nr:polysaccharide biosynthesis tyrosine autokinase [candidate division KSB1 bacterium]